MKKIISEIKQEIETLQGLVQDEKQETIVKNLQERVEKLSQIEETGSTITGLTRAEADNIVKAVVAYNGQIEWNRDFLKYASCCKVRVISEDRSLILKHAGID